MAKRDVEAYFVSKYFKAWKLAGMNNKHHNIYRFIDSEGHTHQIIGFGSTHGSSNCLSQQYAEKRLPARFRACENQVCSHVFS